jgi:hypothetical protein
MKYITTFSSLIKKHTNLLIENMSDEKLAHIDHLDLNKQAIKAAQKELKEINKANKQYIKKISNQEINIFLDYLEHTLIPDLKSSETLETAQDFEICIMIIKELQTYKN